jgi:hypothetical protein
MRAAAEPGLMPGSGEHDEGRGGGAIAGLVAAAGAMAAAIGPILALMSLVALPFTRGIPTVQPGEESAACSAST